MKNNTNIKILVITYDFHPNSTVASFRSLSWSKYFKEFGIEPIILTHSKNFKKEDSNFSIDSIYEDDCCRVVYTHLENNFIDKHENSQNAFYVFLRKLYSFLSILFQFNIRFNQYSPFLRKGTEILEATNIDLILVTGGPFPLFKVAHILSTKYRIPWICDFRDTWSLSKSRNRNILFKIINKYQESKAINSASDIITVSDYLKGLFEKEWKKEVHTIRNGFNDWNFTDKVFRVQSNSQPGTIRIVYSGTIYPHHPIKEIISTVIDLIKEGFDVNLDFIGIGIQHEQKIKTMLSYFKFENKIKFIDRMPNEELLLKIRSYDFALLFNEFNISGTKIYEYLALKMPILFCFLDVKFLDNKDFIFKDKITSNRSNWPQVQMIESSQSGILINDEFDFQKVVKDFLLESNNVNKKFTFKGVEKYSRHEQVKLLSMIIKKRVALQKKEIKSEKSIF
jgi:glycosyltransferase involved in cell wall biosynthesis